MDFRQTGSDQCGSEGNLVIDYECVCRGIGEDRECTGGVRCLMTLKKSRRRGYFFGGSTADRHQKVNDEDKSDGSSGLGTATWRCEI